SAANRGLIIKGGRYLEALAKADVVLVDKTGTLTLGQPQITDVISLNGMSTGELLRMTATAERNSEHPLADAVRRYAREQDIAVGEPEAFEAIPGFGVRATIDGRVVAAGNPRLAGDLEIPAQVDELQTAGKTVLLVTIDGRIVGVLGAEDTIRREVPAAIDELRQYGIEQITLLTGDHDAVARSLAGRLNIDYRANLLPDDKIGVVRELQARGHTVVMIGDGVNDAPAIAQADVGIAMGVAGTPVAIEAAHIALMRDDWMLVPDVFRTARRTMGIVRGNLGFTAVYNLLGLSLAAFGFLPPAIAAAAQAIPDIGILGNSSRLLRGRRHDPTQASEPAPEANPQTSNP
ncbi:MAG: cation-translocating P-type ATPase, partial [Sphaerobacteraceae bacterium]